MKKNDSAATARNGNPSSWLEVVRQNVGQLRYGSVQIIVHEGRVTLVESTEKTRLVAVSGISTQRAK